MWAENIRANLNRFFGVNWERGEQQLVKAGHSLVGELVGPPARVGWGSSYDLMGLLKISCWARAGRPMQDSAAKL